MPKKLEKVICPDEVKEAISSLRSSEELNSYVVVGYSNKNTLCILGKGTGDLREAKEKGLFSNDKCCYAIFKSSHKVELANTVKFAFVDYTPTGISPLRKGLLSTHKGQVQELFHPYHVSLECSHFDTLDPKVIADKIGFSSGTASHVKDKRVDGKAGNKGAGFLRTVPGEKKEIKNKYAVSTKGITVSRKLKMEDGNKIADAIKRVRKDEDPLHWVLVTYANDSTIKLHLTGDSSVADMCKNLTDEEVFYGFFRIEETFDDKVKNTVKFGYFQLVCDKLSPVFKGKLATHRGFVTGIFNPFHEEFLISNKNDISEEIVRQRIRKTTGTDTTILEKKLSEGWVPRKSAATSQGSAAARPTVPRGPAESKGSKKLKFTDPEKFKAMMSALRSDFDPTTWLLARYTKKSTLTPISTGNGGWVDLLKAMGEGEGAGKGVSFALLRIVDQIDKSSTIKFVYFKIQPKEVSPMLKGFCNTQKGAIDALFAPYHVDFFANDPGKEISLQDIKDKVGSASGSKSHVMKKKENI